MTEEKSQARFCIAWSLVLGTLLAPYAFAGQSKPAWQWTAEERLAARFDPDEVTARAEKRDARNKAARESLPPEWASDWPEDSKSSGTLRDEIRGRDTPELFMPIELFNALMESGFLVDREYQSAYRARIEHRAAALGFGKDFWSRLERVAASYLISQRRHEQLATQQRPLSAKAKAELEGVKDRSCKVRAQALSAAKKEFGEEAFLRLLYEVVAIPISISYDVDPQTADNLRMREGGCE